MSEMETGDSVTARFINVSKDSAAFRTECSNLAGDISRNETTIANLVEDLGEYLVNPDHNRREYGTCILYEVIESLPHDFLNSDQLRFICTFFSDRLKDHHTVVPTVLKAILVALRQENVPDGVCSMILTSLFHHVSCQQQQQADRYNVYAMFKLLLEKKGDELNSMGLDFVYGVISAIDGERDPRNLLFLFGWLPSFLRNVELKHLTEEMFDIVSCYFPVDFRVPTQQANAIGRDDLAAALSPCLSAIPSFGEFCIPLALEKLGSNLRIAKLDSLELLFAGCEVFTSDAYLLHSSEIWPLLQKEALHSTDAEILTSCHKTLTAFIAKITRTDSTESKLVLENITDTLKGNLRPDQKLFAQSAEIIKSVAKAGHLPDDIVPLVMNLFNITEGIDGKVLLFKLLVDLFIIHTQHGGDECAGLKLVPNLCLKTSIDPEVRLQVAGLRSLAVIAGSLNGELRPVLYENLKIYLTTDRCSQLNQALVDCVKAYAHVHPQEVAELIRETHRSLQPENFNNFITGIAHLGGSDAFHSVVTRILLLESVHGLQKSSTTIPVLKKLLLQEGGNLGLHEYIREERYVESLIKFILDDNSDSLQNPRSVSNAYFIDVGEVLKMLVGEMGGDAQRDLLNGDVASRLFEIFKSKRSVFVFIVDGLLERLRQDVIAGDFGVFECLLRTALEEDGDLHEAGVRLLANLVNKLNNDETLHKSIEDVEADCDTVISSNLNMERVCSVIAWITKGLTMRGHDFSLKWINKMLALLEKSHFAANGFKVVMKDDYDCLSVAKSYCNRRLLYRQLFFSCVCNNLKKQQKCNEDNPNYLSAFGYMLEEVPEQILKMNFNENLQLIVLCLNKCQDECALVAVLKTLKNMIGNKDELMEAHIQDFVPKFLRLTKFESSMKVRTLSLQCLAYYPNGYTLYKLLPLKTMVISGLADCIDDKKRLVRKEAVETRMSWFLIDAPKD